MRGSRRLDTGSDVQAGPDVHDPCGPVTRRPAAPQTRESPERSPARPARSGPARRTCTSRRATSPTPGWLGAASSLKRIARVVLSSQEARRIRHQHQSAGEPRNRGRITGLDARSRRVRRDAGGGAAGRGLVRTDELARPPRRRNGRRRPRPAPSKASIARARGRSPCHSLHADRAGRICSSTSA